MAAANSDQEIDELKIHTTTAFDWEAEKRKNTNVFDDGTNTFFWRAHTITVLVVFIGFLVYIALFEDPINDSEYNSRRGVAAVVLAFLLFGVTVTPDGPFKRPHPAMWRLVLCVSIVYELALVYLLFQTPADARNLLRHIDSSLGKPLPEKNYGGNCYIYDSDHPDPFHNIKDKADLFVISHFLGWWAKSLFLRDWWICTVLSVMFEVLEYTFEHQLPNFCECWWDHWIMDVVLSNGLGIYVGMKTVKYLKMKPYHWRGMWNIPTYRGKIKRFAMQFTPYSWTEFDWNPLSSLRRWLAVIVLIGLFLLVEINDFYIKFVLWIPPEHYLNVSRIVLVLFMAAPSAREAFQYLDDPTCKKMGRQFWLISIIAITEVLLALKFEWETVTKPIPSKITYMWLLGLVGLVLLTIWKFYIYRDVKNDVPYTHREYQRRRAINKQKGTTIASDDSRSFQFEARRRRFLEKPSNDGTDKQ
ncbi:phosphatidylserine synthase 2-like [Ylistrum balloti]|uniref:phosphatidylserine synthase 2-like n=1 Tax=Ylistrum balloti TaxID=509963 RepID=UPI002905BB2E|nr:phosphatidylserine synthase 2-like [Ylistrum balloti]